MGALSDASSTVRLLPRSAERRRLRDRAERAASACCARHATAFQI